MIDHDDALSLPDSVYNLALLVFTWAACNAAFHFSVHPILPLLEIVTIGMAAYPIPSNVVTFHASYSTIASTDACRIDGLLWIDALKA